MILQVVFPRIRVCSQSMHSKSKLRQYFPYVNQKALQAFYGDFRECFGKRKDEWMVRDEDFHFNKKLNNNSYKK